MDQSAEEGSNSEMQNTSWNVDHENSICKVSFRCQEDRFLFIDVIVIA